MSNHIPFDNHVREQLGQYGPPVPPHLWEVIAAGQDKKKPRAFWWRLFTRPAFWLLLLLATGGGVAYWLTADNNQPVETVPVAVQTGEQAADKTTAVNDIPVSNNGSNQIAPSVTASATPIVPAATVASDNNGTTAAVSQDKLPAATGIVNNNNNAANSGGTAAPHRTNINFANTPANQFVRSKKQYNNFPVATRSAVDANDGTVNDAAYTADAAMVSSLSLPALAAMAADKLGKQSATGTTDLRKKAMANLNLPDCPGIEADAAGNKRYFEVYAGPDMGIRSFGSFGADSTSDAYLQRRKQSTKFRSAFSAGVRYTRVFANGISLRTGVNYSQLNEKFQYINPKDIRYILVITPRDVIIGGVNTTIYDTLRYVQEGTRVRTTYNRYRNVDIPLQVGYEFGNGRLHTNISAGVIVNLYSWQRGDMLDSAYQPVSITTGKANGDYGFRTNIGAGFLGCVSMYYKLNSRLHILAEPFLRYNFNPITSDKLNITQKYHTIGLRLGVRWDLR